MDISYVRNVRRMSDTLIGFHPKGHLRTGNVTCNKCGEDLNEGYCECFYCGPVCPSCYQECINLDIHCNTEGIK